MDLSVMINRVCLASRKTLSGLIAKCKDMGGFHYNTYSCCILSALAHRQCNNNKTDVTQEVMLHIMPRARYVMLHMQHIMPRARYVMLHMQHIMP